MRCQRARRRVGDKVALQGNIDPNVLFGTPETIAAEAKKVLDSFGPGNTGHVFNLGHGISQYTPPENVTVLVETVHAHSRTLRKSGLTEVPGLDLCTSFRPRPFKHFSLSA